MCNPGRLPAILCIGQDRQLLELRCLVLHRSYPVVTTATPDGLQRLSAREFNIVLLCHTLTAEQDEFCLRYIAGRWPGASIARIRITAVNDLRQAVSILANNPAVLLDGLRQIASALA